MTRIATLLAATLAALVFPISAAFASCHVVKFIPGQYDIDEDGGTVTIGVQNPGEDAKDRTVDWETVNGSAKAGSDFVAASGTLSFTPRDRSKVIEVVIINNDTYESRELFTVRFIARQGSCISQNGIGPPAGVAINDDDPKSIKPTPTPTKTKSTAPAPSQSSSPKVSSPTPTPTATRSASPSPSPSSSPSPSPSTTVTAVAVSDQSSDGGLGGGALAGIIGGAVVVGGGAAFWVRRRFLT